MLCFGFRVGGVVRTVAYTMLTVARLEKFDGL